MSDIKLPIGKSDGNETSINAQELVTGRTCVIGQSGSGKSYFIAVLCEKLLKNNIGFCIIDTEGEYFSLKEKFELFWIGGENADISLDYVNDDLIKKIIDNNIPAILDVSDSFDERATVDDFIQKLYKIEDKKRVPYLLIIEESDKFIPQNKNSLKIIEEISRRGRKRGLGLLLATQRPALVNKNVLSQCGSQIIGKLTTENDLAAVNLFFANRKELEDLPKLKVGEFFVMGNITENKIKIKSDKRETQHKGLTPKLITKASGKIAEIKSGLEIPEKSKTLKGDMGIKTTITENDVKNIAESKRKKKYNIFGEKEKLGKISLDYTPLIHISVKIKSGLVKKNYKEHSFIIDGISGSTVNIEKGFRRYIGFDPYLELGENEVSVLHQFSKSKLSIDDIASKAKLSSTTVRKSISLLEDKKILTFVKEGRSKLYTPLIKLKFPEIRTEAVLPKLDKIENCIQPKINKDQMEKLIKGFYPEAAIMGFSVFYYPIWTAKIGKREIEIDGVTGNVI